MSHNFPLIYLIIDMNLYGLMMKLLMKLDNEFGM